MDKISLGSLDLQLSSLPTKLQKALGRQKSFEKFKKISCISSKMYSQLKSDYTFPKLGLRVQQNDPNFR